MHGADGALLHGDQGQPQRGGQSLRPCRCLRAAIPVYGLAATADLFVFNTIEFWSGKNPITGKSPALVDHKADAVIKVNQHLDPALNKVPLAMLPQGVREVKVSYPDERTAQMEIHYIDGHRDMMRGEMRGELLDIYLDDKLVSTLTRKQLDEKANAGKVAV